VMSPAELAEVSVGASAPPARIRETLQRHGVCLVLGVLSPQERTIMQALWARDLVGLLADPSAAPPELTDAAERLRVEGLPRAWPECLSGYLGRPGVAAHRGMAHGAFAWAARLHPAVRHVFSALHEVPADEMCVGLDCVFYMPGGTPAVDSDREWLHVDQNHHTGMTSECGQGVLYVWPSDDEASSTTVIWPRSHREVYDELMTDEQAIVKGRKASGHLVRLADLHDEGRRERLLAAARHGARRMPCPAGSLLLWDSRTVHQGWASGARLAQPVCWEPRSRRDAGALNRKLYMCAAGVPSSHSGSDGRVHAMVRGSRPEPTAAAADAPALVSMLTPYCVAPGEEGAWRAMQDELWAGRGPQTNAGRGNPTLYRRLLRAEVVEAL